MFAAVFLAAFAADDCYVFQIDAACVRRFALVFHRTRIAFAFAAAVRAVAARGSRFCVGSARVLIFHRANAVFTAAFHRRFMRRII